jgi:threonine/homoserine/homoserine lactone efflux protein
MTTALSAFAVAATLLILAPGPDSLLVIRNTLRAGSRVGFATTAGTLTGLFSWAVAAGLGLSAVLAASRVGYDVLRGVGAAYLIWLGATSLLPRLRRRSNPSAQKETTVVERVPTVSLRRAYLNGVISNLCNPKIGVFFVAFLPGFIPPGVSVRAFSLLLGVWFVLETGIWLATLVRMVTHGFGLFSRTRIQRRLEQLTGVVLIGFGIRLATEAR